MNLYGASGHAKVIIEIVHSVGETVHTVFDVNEELREVLGYQVVHSESEVAHDEGTTIISIGNNRTRKRITRNFRGRFHPALAHASAVVSPSAKIGEGTVIMANATINAEARIGDHCIINTGAVVEHEVRLEDFVHISPNASVAGNVQIGEGTHIGIGASIIPGIKIGKWVTVGAGAVIIKDIPDFAVVVGNPGRIVNISTEISE